MKESPPAWSAARVHQFWAPEEEHAETVWQKICLPTKQTMHEWNACSPESHREIGLCCVGTAALDTMLSVSLSLIQTVKQLKEALERILNMSHTQGRNVICNDKWVWNLSATARREKKTTKPKNSLFCVREMETFRTIDLSVGQEERPTRWEWS